MKYTQLLRGLAALLLVCTAFADTQPFNGLVNYETPHVHPIDLTPDKQTLVAVSTANHSLEVFDVSGGNPVFEFSIPVGMDPVSVRARGNDEIWVVNHLSDSVSIISLARKAVVGTLQTDNEPADVVFAGSPTRAFVSCSEANSIQVFNPGNLSAAPQTIDILGEDPRALAVSPDGNTVYAAIFESGNASTALAGGGSVNARNVVSRAEGPYGGQNPPPNNGNNFSPPIATTNPPTTAMIVKKDTAGRWMDDNNGDWSIFVNGSLASLTSRVSGWDLRDRDVAIINANTNAVSYQRSLMNMVMAIGVNPASGQVTVVGTDSTNEVRFEPNLNGSFVRVNSARFTPGGTAQIRDLNPHLDYSVATVAAGVRAQSIGDPRGIAWRGGGGQAFVVGMGSNNVVVIDTNGNRVDHFPVGQGPTGIVLNENANRGYVMNKFAGTISMINLNQFSEISATPFNDPTPAAIKAGRPFLYDTHLTSGLGQVSCASCHVDARTDRLAWDLGDPQGSNATVLNASNSTGNTSGTTTVHPMKGPMLTQSLQDIIGFSTFHWRGDRANLAAFNGTFTNLMGRPSQISAAQMQAFEDFLATIHLPPNPYRNIDNTRPATVTLPDGFVATTTSFQSLRGQNSRSNNCMGCHMNGEQRNDASNRELSQAFIAQAWSPFYERMGFFPEQQTTSTAGFGFFHDGADNYQGAARTDTAENQSDMIAELMTLEGPGGPLTGPEIRQDTHAGVGQQITIEGTLSASENARLNQLVNIAGNSPFAEMVVHGEVNGETRGFRLVSGTTFESDREGDNLSLAQLRTIAANDNALTFTIVANDMSWRLGVDRNFNGVRDGDESPQFSIDIQNVELAANGGNISVTYTNAGPIQLNDGWMLFIEADENANTGYSTFGIGADFLIRDNVVFAYTGTGTNWSWNSLGAAGVNTSGNTATLTFPEAWLGGANNLSAVFYGDNSFNAGGNGTVSFGVGGGITLSLGNMQIGGINIDGSSNDWPDAFFQGFDPDDVSGAANRIDLRELYLYNQNNHQFLFVKNDQAVQLNEGWMLFFDTDQNGSTGYQAWSAGAEYLLRNRTVYRYTGNGTNWSWTAQGTALAAENNQWLEIGFPQSFLGGDSNFDFLFFGDNSFYQGGSGNDLFPDGGLVATYPQATNQSGITIDGNLADWNASQRILTDGDDTAAGNQIDILEVYMEHDNGQVFVGVQNAGNTSVNDGWILWFDEDQNANTGFRLWNFGADIMIRGNQILTYTGTGSNWSWSATSSATAAANGSGIEWQFPRSIFDPARAAVRIVVYGANTSIGGNEDDVSPENGGADGRGFWFSF